MEKDGSGFVWHITPDMLERAEEKAEMLDALLTAMSNLMDREITELHMAGYII